MLTYHLYLYCCSLPPSVEGDDFCLLTQEVTFDQGATTGSTQNASIEIIDDSLVEGTESFVISGSVTAPASSVPGGDTVTVDILDNDGDPTANLFRFTYFNSKGCVEIHECNH